MSGVFHGGNIIGDTVGYWMCVPQMLCRLNAVDLIETCSVDETSAFGAVAIIPQIQLTCYYSFFSIDNARVYCHCEGARGYILGLHVICQEKKKSL